MKPKEIIELFEPKLPPINLWCLPSASWFYRRARVTQTPYQRHYPTIGPSEIELRYKDLRKHR